MARILGQVAEYIGAILDLGPIGVDGSRSRIMNPPFHLSCAAGLLTLTFSPSITHTTIGLACRTTLS